MRAAILVLLLPTVLQAAEPGNQSQARPLKILGATTAFAGKYKSDKEGIRTVIRTADELAECYGSPIGALEAKAREAALKKAASAFKVKAIDFEKQMIAVVGVEHTATPKTTLEIYEAQVAEDGKSATIFWRFVSPEIDVTQVGPPRLHAVLVERFPGKVTFEEGKGRGLEK